MISSIVLTGRYNIGINSGGKVLINDEVTPLSDVPFIRYRLADFSEENIEFVKANMEKFKGPCHLAEFDLMSMPVEQLEALNNVDNLAIFVYIDIDDADLASGISDEKRAKLEAIKGLFFDRLIIRDKSTMLYPLKADKLTFELSDLVDGCVSARDIGICCSPLTPKSGPVESRACISAMWARKLMAEYTDNVDGATPTANHETCSKSGCCCIRYIVVSADVPAPAENTKAAEPVAEAKKSTPKTPKAEKAPKEAKPPKPKGVRSLADFV